MPRNNQISLAFTALLVLAFLLAGNSIASVLVSALVYGILFDIVLHLAGKLTDATRRTRRAHGARTLRTAKYCIVHSLPRPR